MAGRLSTSHFPILTPQELSQNFLRSDRFLIVDLKKSEIGKSGTVFTSDFQIHKKAYPQTPKFLLIPTNIP